MNEHERDTLIAWLNDAYGMEQGLVQTLERQADHAQDHLEVRERLRAHADLTRSQAERVKACVAALGGSTSALKTAMGKMEGIFSGVSTAAARDTLIKDALAGFAAENLEIASYRALVTAAETLGEQQVVQTCKEILREEEEMARWLEQNLPMLVRDYLQREAQSAAV